MTANLSRYRAALRPHHNAFNQTDGHSTNRYQYNRLAAAEGEGYVDYADFGRLSLARGDYILRRPRSITTPSGRQHYGITIPLRGDYRLDIPVLNREHAIRAPLLGLRKGQLGDITIHLPANSRISLIALEFGPELTAGCHGHIAAFYRSPQQAAVHIDRLPAPLHHHAARLLALPPVADPVALIRLESAALALLAALLDAPPPNPTIAAALAILHDEYREPPTIRQLARRVGSNECTLKRTFKAHTGSTIAAYIRAYRLHIALDLLADGADADSISAQIGYENPAYFRRLFARHYGYKP